MSDPDIDRAWDQAVGAALPEHWRKQLAEPTLLQRALALRKASLAFTRITQGSAIDVLEWRAAETIELITAQAFFDALEAETGIDRELFRQLGVIA